MLPRARIRRALRGALVICIGVFVLFIAFRFTGAGSLTPDAAPASTMNTAEDIYDSMVGTFDSSAVVASQQGNALQISKCIISAITGGAGCP